MFSHLIDIETNLSNYSSQIKIQRSTLLSLLNSQGRGPINKAYKLTLVHNIQVSKHLHVPGVSIKFEVGSWLEKNKRLYEWDPLT